VVLVVSGDLVDQALAAEALEDAGELGAARGSPRTIPRRAALDPVLGLAREPVPAAPRGNGSVSARDLTDLGGSLVVLDPDGKRRELVSGRP